MMRHTWFLVMILILAAHSVEAGPYDRDTTLFGPVTEWSLPNPTYSGNAYDLDAAVTFQHDATGATRTTRMYFDDVTNTWNFRFTGTKTGTWQFSSVSADEDLSGLSGTVTVAASPDPEPRGFLVAAGSMFARQIGETGLKGEPMHVYMNMRDPTETPNPGFGTLIESQGGHNAWNPISAWDEPQERTAFINQAIDNGMNAIFLELNAQWFQAGVTSTPDLCGSCVNPDGTTFRALEEMITDAHTAGVEVVIWPWGDDAPHRKWTPNHLPLDGQNGSADQRMQRYIAARLGPLPGWSMGYGFDLEEWATESETRVWANYLHGQMGWDHLLWGRRRSNSSLDVVSNDKRPFTNPNKDFYTWAVEELNVSGGRPVIFERRFGYMRDDFWTDERTRQSMWQFTMAGGAAGWYGFRSTADNVPGRDGPLTAPGPFLHPEQLRAHSTFWEDRLLIDMERHNELTSGSDAWALASPTLDNIVIYAQDTNIISLNLGGIPGQLTAVAVDAKDAYHEIPIGLFNSGTTQWNAPYTSDWALAINSSTNADFNNNGFVDGSDFLTWQRFFPTNGGATNGDANGDGNVLSDDLEIWESQFGGPPPLSVAAVAVPEPASSLIALCGLLMVSALRQRI